MKKKKAVAVFSPSINCQSLILLLTVPTMMIHGLSSFLAPISAVFELPPGVLILLNCCLSEGRTSSYTIRFRQLQVVKGALTFFGDD